MTSQDDINLICVIPPLVYAPIPFTSPSYITANRKPAAFHQLNEG